MATKTKISVPRVTARPVSGQQETDLALLQLASTTIDPLLQAVVELQTLVNALNAKVGI